MTTVHAPDPEPAAVWLQPDTPPHLSTLILMAGLAALNMNIFLPSLPSMAAFFEADYAVVSLAVSAYLAMTAIMQLFVGPLSDRFGRRPVMLWALVVFLLATVGCVLAEDVVTFLAFRLIQAAVATGMVLSRAVVRDLVGPDQAASKIGYVTMGMALMPMIGPIIGGWLDDAFGWQASFLFVLAFGLAVGAICWFDMGETNHTRSSSVTTQFRQYPELATSHRFWGYALVAAFASGAFFAFLGGGPWVATEVLGITATRLGFYFAFIAIGYMLGNFLSGLYAEAVGLNRMMMSGTVFSAAGMLGGLVLFMVGFVHPITLFGAIFFVGIGNGLSMPAAMAGMVSVRPQLAGSASGLGGAVMIGGGAALAALTGALLRPEWGAYPLLLMMLLSSALSIGAAMFVLSVARRRAREAAEA
ncbi:MAG: multidrug effflux MFS transporter [Pseudomonadota bacterium]